MSQHARNNPDLYTRTLSGAARYARANYDDIPDRDECGDCGLRPGRCRCYEDEPPLSHLHPNDPANPN